MKWLLIYAVSSMTNLLPATPAGCNPSLDLLFTLGSESYLDFAERIIGDLARQPLPPYTIQTGFSICDNSSVAFIPLMSRFVQVMTSIKTISKGLLAESRLRHEQKISYSNKQCLQVSKDIFQRSPRNNVPKMLIFVTDGTGWASADHARDAAELKLNNITIVTIGIGIKQIDISTHLENMASDNSRYFIIRDMSLLPSLSSIFSKGSCQSLGIDMSSMVIISPTEETMSLTSDNLEKQVAGCQSIILNVTHYEEVRMIPGFGSLKQVLACPRNQFYDVTRCGCS